jgi:predicted GIY-YIG superfamily endonuclease
MSFILYRIFNSGEELLYVGATMNPSQRFQTHGSTRDWWADAATITLAHFDTFEDLAAAEIEAIEAEKPVHNLAHPTSSTPWCYKERRPTGEGSISQRSSDGLWVGSFWLPKDADGKRRQRRVYSKDRAEVERKLAELRADLEESRML